MAMARLVLYAENATTRLCFRSTHSGSAVARDPRQPRPTICSLDPFVLIHTHSLKRFVPVDSLAPVCKTTDGEKHQ